VPHGGSVACDRCKPRRTELAEAGSLNEAQTEDVGQAPMALATTIRDLTLQFDLTPEDLNLDFGPRERLI
jgi:hypothetical protein